MISAPKSLRPEPVLLTTLLYSLKNSDIIWSDNFKLYYRFYSVSGSSISICNVSLKNKNDDLRFMVVAMLLILVIFNALILLAKYFQGLINVFLFSSLTALDSKANNLSSLSKKYRQDAKYLNMRSTYAKLAAVAVFFIMLIVYVRFWWLWNNEYSHW